MRTLYRHLSWGLVPALAACLTTAAEAATLTIRLQNPPATGTVSFLLFNTPNTFGDLRDPVRVVSFDLDGREAYVVEDLVPGEYALLVHYDENDNGRIDKNFIGIPKEPLGFSNEYRPKGPPSYSRAAFQLTEQEPGRFDVDLYRPLGRRGRLGVGVGVIGRSSPYAGYESGVYRAIPAVTYTGSRLQWYGPAGRLSLAGTGQIRLALTGSYRIGVYEEDESEALAGMGDREDTFMAGLALQAELPGGVDFSAGYEHDVLDQIGGGAARISLDKSFQFGITRLSPEFALNWLSEELANHDYGVLPDQAAPGRPAYLPGSTLSAEIGLGLFLEVTEDWLIVLQAAVERLVNNVTESPIVDEDYVVKGFAAINYVF